MTESGHESAQVQQQQQQRSTILGSLFLHGRPRNSSQSHISSNDARRDTSPSPPQPPSPGGITSGHRRNRAPPTATTVRPSSSHPSTTTTTTNTNHSTTTTTTPTAPSRGLSHMLRRRRSANNVSSNTASAAAAPAIPSQPTLVNTAVTTTTTTTQQPATASSTNACPNPASTSNPVAAGSTNNSAPAGPSTHRIRLVPHIDSRRTLRFDAIARDVKEGDQALRIGRFTDRSGLGLAAVNALNTNRLAFKSKVVSRSHAEIWVDNNGKFFIKDTKSSSGTFLNHVRLSPANTESRPYQMKDGDILQLGVDYQGGAEDIYKSVKIRVEIGREWQSGANAFNTNTLKILRSLALAPNQSAPGAQSTQAPVLGKISTAVAVGTTANAATSSPTPKSQIPDCCICLFGVTIRQALFIAPCSHTFHYKCIRPLLESHHPAFSCPLCRTFADLEDDVEVEVEVDWNDEEEAGGLLSDGGAQGEDACLATSAGDNATAAVPPPGDGDDESVGAGGGGGNDPEGRAITPGGDAGSAPTAAGVQRRLSGVTTGIGAGISEEEDGGDVVYMDYAMGDATGGGGGADSEGTSGGGIGENATTVGMRGDSPALLVMGPGGDLAQVAEVDEMDVDGTVGGKRKR